MKRVLTVLFALTLLLTGPALNAQEADTTATGQKKSERNI